eukprot:3042669-Rhodomonas_salina.3
MTAVKRCAARRSAERFNSRMSSVVAYFESWELTLQRLVQVGESSTSTLTVVVFVLQYQAFVLCDSEIQIHPTPLLLAAVPRCYALSIVERVL